ncbi:hypothetical protein [Enterovibrio norvegicus]|uniref:hypothetical protein n=1 Tax=Enterovibrio norvegicus TaxID=188144 RepID=UPI0039AFFD89
MTWRIDLKILMFATRTAETLVSRYHVDVAHGQKVKVLTLALLKQVQPQVTTTVTNELYDLVGWAALLHEVGQSIAFQGYHRHSAYLLKHTTMPGFNTEQQRLISTLVRHQRKALKRQDFAGTVSIYSTTNNATNSYIKTRYLTQPSAKSSTAPDVTLTIEQQDNWELKGSNSDWLAQNQLLEYELKEEQQRWQNAGWSLKVE